MALYLTTPFTQKKAEQLRAGDSVLLSGTIYTARDAAHQRMIQLLSEGKPLPFPIEDSILYYVGPSPSRPEQVIGSAGPTTSYRMDSYTPLLLEKGLRGMIGKGSRSQEVIESMYQNKAVYFGAIGGAAAVLGQSIVKSAIVAYEDLGTEAIRKLQVENMPLKVVIDSQGRNLYKLGPEQYKTQFR